MYRTLLQNHPLANLTFLLVLIIGLNAYNSMPRQQDPTINFNWINIITVLPGATAEDVEKRITTIIEDKLEGLQDVKFVDSTSRESLSNILLRFNDIDTRTFDKRLNDLRQLVRQAENNLPNNAREPIILEINSANAYPTAVLALTGEAYNEKLRYHAAAIRDDIKRFKSVDNVQPAGLNDPEIHIEFDPHLLEQAGLSPSRLADLTRSWFEDIAAGQTEAAGQSWLVRMVNQSAQIDEISNRTLVSLSQEMRLSDIATVSRGQAFSDELVSVENHPAILIPINKKADENSIQLVAQVQAYMDIKNTELADLGLRLIMTDEQTKPTKKALSVMQSNALIGLFMVLLVSWFFLGFNIAFFTAIGIAFTLAGTFALLHFTGETLNTTVLLGVVIVLGMLVDDAVVMVEAIHHHSQKGKDALTASVDALREIGWPITSGILTTVAIFFSLVLLPGILGDFMSVVPMVVTVALLISLVEAFWMLPVHIIGGKQLHQRLSGSALSILATPFVFLDKQITVLRQRFVKRASQGYSWLLIRLMRYTWVFYLSLIFLFAAGAAAFSKVDKNFFAADAVRLIYLNIEMSPDAPLEKTLHHAQQLENIARKYLQPEELRTITTYAGQQFTETAPVFGDQYGQVLIGLQPKEGNMRTVQDIRDAMYDEIIATQTHEDVAKVSFLLLLNGPPAGKDIEVKVRGDNYAQIKQASEILRTKLSQIEGVKNVTDDAGEGRLTLTLQPDESALQRAGLTAADIARITRILIDGEFVGQVQDQGELIDIRLYSSLKPTHDITDILNVLVPTPSGESVTLANLVKIKRERSLANIRHYNFKKVITITADVDVTQNDIVSVNNQLKNDWSDIAAKYNGVNLDFAGQLDDIEESISALQTLLLVGIALMYLILATQFQSYVQPILILFIGVMSVIGVPIGLYINNQPFSLYTIYGTFALIGIAVNAGILIIAATNERLKLGLSTTHAVISATRRRFIPIIIVTVTTIAGLASLAFGFGGKSVVWGSVATAIVFGMLFSCFFSLTVTPTAYRAYLNAKPTMRRAYHRIQEKA